MRKKKSPQSEWTMNIRPLLEKMGALTPSIILDYAMGIQFHPKVEHE
jgi:hypothetical protein